MLCHRPTGLTTDDGVIFGETCARVRFHLGRCKAHLRRTRIRSFYEINREVWPDMSRLRAAWSAIRCWWMCRNADEVTT